jgi:hypothetical protein
MRRRLERGPGLGAVHCGWARVTAEGRTLEESVSPEEGDLFATLAHRCPFANRPPAGRGGPALGSPRGRRPARTALGRTASLMPPVDLGAALRGALRTTAAAMERAAVGTPAAGLGERRHLWPAFLAALRAALPEAREGSRVAVIEDHPLGVEGWPSRVGVDVALVPVAADGTLGAPAFLEVAWGGDALAGCAWDVARLGAAAASGRAAAGFVVAGAPARRWREPAEGPELFERGTLTLERLRSGAFLRAWARRAQEGAPQPERLPERFRIDRFAAVPMDLAGDRWELRAARVGVPAGTPWVEVPRLRAH